MLWALLLGAISVPPTFSATPGQLSVFWKTDQPETTQIAWGLVPARDFGAYPSSLAIQVLTTSHSRTLADLPPGQYYFRVRSSTGAPGAAPDDSAELTVQVQRGKPGQALFTNMLDLNGTAVHVNGRTLFVGGEMNAVVRRKGQFVQVDGATGQLADGVPRIEGWVNTSVPDGLGGVYLGGPFNADGLGLRHGLVHLLPGGGLDPDFVAPTITDVDGIVLRGSTLFAFGAFVTVGGMPRVHAAALDARTGALLPLTLDFAGNYVDAVFDTGTAVYVVGDFTGVLGAARIGAAALNLSAISAAVLPFNPMLDAPATGVAVLGSSVYLCGPFTQAGGQARASLARVDATTGLGTVAWAPTVDSAVLTIAAAGSSIYLGGTFTTVNGTPHPSAAALDATSGALLQWNPAPDNTVLTVLPSSGRMLLGGNFVTVGGTSRRGLAAVDPDTGDVLPFDWSGAGRVVALSESSGTLWTSLSFGGERVADRSGLAAFDADTGALLPFAPNPNDLVNAFASTALRLYAVGDFTEVAGQPRGRGVAFDVATLTLQSWDPQCDGDIEALAVGPEVIYLGGSFTHCRGLPRSHAAAVDDVEGLLLPWNPNPDGEVRAIAVSGATVFLGGAFQNPAPYLLSTNFDTGNPQFFGGPVLDNDVWALQVRGSDLVVGGTFSSPLRPQRLMALDIASGTVGPLDAALDGPVRALAAGSPIAATSSIVAGGTFVHAGTDYHRGGIALTSAGAPAPAFDVDMNGGAVAATIDCLAGRVHFAGGFLDGAPTTQNGVISCAFPVACFGGTPPSVTGNQLGDLTWRRMNDGLYDVDFSDAEGLSQLWLAAYDLPGGGPNRSFDWGLAMPLTGTAYTTDWKLPDVMWSAFREGMNHVWVRVYDSQGNGAELSDAFFVRKDTVAPTAPAVTGAAWDGGTLALAWLASSDATSGVAGYQVQEEDGGAVTTDAGLFAEVPVTGPSQWVVVAIDLAGNVSAPSGPVTLLGDGGLDVGPQPGDGGAADGGVGRQKFLAVGCSCNAGNAPLDLGLLALAIHLVRRRRSAKRLRGSTVTHQVGGG